MDASSSLGSNTESSPAAPLESFATARFSSATCAVLHANSVQLYLPHPVALYCCHRVEQRTFPHSGCCPFVKPLVHSLHQSRALPHGIAAESAELVPARRIALRRQSAGLRAPRAATPPRRSPLHICIRHGKKVGQLHLGY